jgi:acyl-CoA thioesterase
MSGWPPKPDFPLRELLGFEVDVVDGVVVGTLELDERHLNPNMVAHGGVCFTLMDTIMGAAVMGAVPEGHACATVEMQTRFHKGVKTGVLTARAEVFNATRRIAHARATTVDEAGDIVASATATFALFEPR